MLLAVVALALTGGPLPGLLTGFLAGLALDVAPPASHTDRAVCAGVLPGRLRLRPAGGLGHASPALYVAISAAAAAAGAALHAALGVMLSDPEVTWAAVRHVLPPSLIYDVILSPFVLYAVVRLNGWGCPSRSRGERGDRVRVRAAARAAPPLPPARSAAGGHVGLTPAAPG